MWRRRPDRPETAVLGGQKAGRILRKKSAYYQWDDSRDEILNVLDELEEKKEIGFPLPCPVCHRKSAHIYMRRWESDFCWDHGRGTIWVWCSSCRACQHISRVVLPDWWEADDFMEESELTSHPVYLEAKSAVVDAHLKKLLEGREK